LQNVNSEYSVPDYEPDPSPVGDLDGLIRLREQELRPFIGRMEELRLQFINDLTDFAIRSYQEFARQYVLKYPEVTLALSKDELASMKARVAVLQENASKVVRSVFSNAKIWWHLEPSLHDTSQYELLGNSDVGNRFPEKVDKPVRRVLGELGKVLEYFGYNVTTTVPQKKGGEEFWFSVPDSELSAPEPYYPHLLVWSDEMQGIIQKYNTEYKKAYVIFVEIEKLKAEEKKQQASQLWDST